MNFTRSKTHTIKSIQKKYLDHKEVTKFDEDLNDADSDEVLELIKVMSGR